VTESYSTTSYIHLGGVKAENLIIICPLCSAYMVTSANVRRLTVLVTYLFVNTSNNTESLIEFKQTDIAEFETCTLESNRKG
jgi:hypothetical protein